MAQETHKGFADWSGWDYLPGVAFIVIGVLALMLAPITSIAAGIYLGAMLCVVGGFGLVGGIAHISRRGAWLVALLGVLSLIVGIQILYHPIAAAISVTWLLGAWFLVGGIFELVNAFTVKVGRTWLIVVALINILFGAYVLFMNPVNAFLFLGYLVGVSLLLRGLWSVIFVNKLHHVGQAFREAVA
jgi:uncharacterized membrane protein HdeD (DUF308 family)